MKPLRPWILGMGCTPVGEHWSQSLYDLATEAIHAALADAGVDRVDALVVGNMLSGVLNRQENLAAALADRAGLSGIEAIKVEAACASGGAALQVGAAMVASHTCERVLVLGVEKMTDADPAAVIQGLAYAADFESETIIGASFSGLSALLTSLYLQATGATPEDLSVFVRQAHQHAIGNPWAMYRHAVTAEEWGASPMISDPLRLLDCTPLCDGAAAVVLGRPGDLHRHEHRPVEIASIAGAVETIALAQRPQPLRLKAVEQSVARALERAEVSLPMLDLTEFHDAFPVMTALSLEAAGFMPAGTGWRYFDAAADAHLRIPIQTMGGLKARGHPVGATGVYQVIEATLQLQGRAGENQVLGAKTAMTQCSGGLGGNVFTSILRQATP